MLNSVDREAAGDGEDAAAAKPSGFHAALAMASTGHNSVAERLRAFDGSTASTMSEQVTKKPVPFRFLWLDAFVEHGIATLSATELRAALVIFRRAGTDGTKAHPGLNYLAAAVAAGSKSRAQEAITKLCAIGWVRQSRKGGGVRNDGVGIASEYELQIPDKLNVPGLGTVPEGGTDEKPETGTLQNVPDLIQKCAGFDAKPGTPINHNQPKQTTTGGSIPQTPSAQRARGTTTTEGGNLVVVRTPVVDWEQKVTTQGGKELSYWDWWCSVEQSVRMTEIFDQHPCRRERTQSLAAIRGAIKRTRATRGCRDRECACQKGERFGCSHAAAFVLEATIKLSLSNETNPPASNEWFDDAFGAEGIAEPTTNGAER